MFKFKGKMISLASQLLVCIAAIVATATCYARFYEPPMPEKLRKQLED